MGRRDATTRQQQPGAAGDRRRLRRRSVHQLRLGAAAATVLALAGCYLLDPDLLTEGTDEVSIEVGETAQVALGDWSPGVGDSWGAVPATEGAASQDGTAEYDTVDDGVVTSRVVMNSEVFGVRDRRDGLETGGSFPYAVELTGLSPGTSTVRIIYCYRTTITEDCDQGPRDIDPIELTVTVS